MNLSTLSCLLIVFLVLQLIYFSIVNRKTGWVLVFVVVGLFFIPLLTLLFHVEHNHFIWIKYYSLVLSCMLLGIMKFSDLIPEKYFTTIIRLILYLNIAEAVIKNFDTVLTGNLDHIFPSYFLIAVGLTGVISILALPSGAFAKKAIAYNSKGKEYTQLSCDIPISWIALYLVWNWSFIFSEFPNSIGTQTVIIISSIIAPLWSYNRKLWFETRALTITIGVMIHFSLGDNLLRLILLNYTAPNIPFVHFVMIVNILLSFILVYQRWFKEAKQAQML